MKTIAKKFKLQHLAWALAALWGLTCLAYEFYTPKSVGETPFPLKLAWSTTMDDGVHEIFISEDDHILVRSSYSINAIDFKDGKLLWKHIIDEGVNSVYANKGFVYLVTPDNLYKFNEESGNLKWKTPLWQKVNYPSISGEILDITNKYIVVHFRADKFEIYYIQSGKYVADIEVRGDKPACINNDIFYTSDFGIQSHELASGKLLWEDISTQRVYDGVCSDGILYFSKGNTEVIAYDLASRSILWRIPASVSENTSLKDFSIQGNYLFIGNGSTFYILDKNTGRALQSVVENVGHPAYPQIIGGNLFVFLGFDETIHSYNLETWEDSGTLRIAPPSLFFIPAQKILNRKDNTLIFWKDKTIYAYQK